MWGLAPREVYSTWNVLLPPCLYIPSIWKTAFIFLYGKNSRSLYYLISDPHLTVQSVIEFKKACFSCVILFADQCVTATWIILLLLLGINLSCTNVFINTCILILSVSIKILKNNKLFFYQLYSTFLCILSTPYCIFMCRKYIFLNLSVALVNTWQQFVHFFFYSGFLWLLLFCIQFIANVMIFRFQPSDGWVVVTVLKKELDHSPMTRLPTTSLWVFWRLFLILKHIFSVANDPGIPWESKSKKSEP